MAYWININLFFLDSNVVLQLIRRGVPSLYSMLFKAQRAKDVRFHFNAGAHVKAAIYTAHPVNLFGCS